MTERKEMVELAGRVEAAGGADQKLDALIDCWLQQRTGFVWTGHYYNCDQLPNAGGDQIPAYTASLDAALSLVPEGCDWLINSRCNFAQVWERKGVGDGSWQCDHAATPALALCAAALRALAAHPHEGEEHA